MIAFFTAPAVFLAQDVIYKADGSKLQAKVLEVGITDIKYKSVSNPDGPLYVLSKSDVVLIAYQNGEHETFVSPNDKKSEKKAKDDSLSKNRNKNIVSINVLDMAFASITLSYERVFCKGRIGVKVPVSVGLRPLSNPWYGSDHFALGKIWSAGADVNFYPTGQGRVRYFVGPGLTVGQYQRSQYFSLLADYTQIDPVRVMHYGLVINNGLMVQPTENFNMSFGLGLGMKYDKAYYYDRIEPKVSGMFNVGYRF